MSVEKLDDGTGYKVRWRDAAGKSRRKKVTRWRDAIALDGEIKRKKAMGELIAHERGTITLNDFWEVWWRQYGVVHLTPRTQQGYQIAWEKRIKPQLGSRKLRSIQRNDIVALVAELVLQGYSSSTVRTTMMVLQGALARAVEWQYIGTNVAMGVKRPILESRRGRPLTDEQLDALLKELDARSALIVRILAETGLRPGELRALRWGDLGDSGIVVERAISRNQVGPTKNNKKRTVQLRPAARKAFIEWKLMSGPKSRDDLIFPAARGPGVWTDSGYNLWAKRTVSDAAARAGLRGLVVYDLRHTFVSKLIKENDRDIYWIARQAGHSPEVALTTYAHFFDGDDRVPSERPAAWLSAESSSPLGDLNP